MDDYVSLAALSSATQLFILSTPPRPRTSSIGITNLVAWKFVRELYALSMNSCLRNSDGTVFWKCVRSNHHQWTLLNVVSQLDIV